MTDSVEEGAHMDEIPKMDLTEFREAGYLQELNRQFLHPLGLALSVEVQEDGEVTSLGPIWDFRDDPEGLGFTDDELGTEASREKARRVEQERRSKAATRRQSFGGEVQPIPDDSGGEA